MQIRTENLKKKYDYIIIGAGIIGITILKELLKKEKKNILIIESGSMLSSNPYPSYQNIISKKFKIKNTSQFSGVGGGSNVWGSISGIFDSQSIESFFKKKKFPINSSDYKKYLKKTAEYGFPEVSEFKCNNLNDKFLRTKKFVQVTPKVKFFQFSSLLENEHVDFLQNCYVEEITKSKTIQKQIKFRSIKNEFFITKGEKIILCANTIENYKLLKKSNLNLNHKMLGKGFMNHPKGVVGSVKFKKDFNKFISKESNNRISYYGLQLKNLNYNHYLKLNKGFKIPFIHYISKKISGSLKIYDGNFTGSNISVIKNYSFFFISKVINIIERIINKIGKGYVYIELFTEMKLNNDNTIIYDKNTNKTSLRYELSNEEVKTAAELLNIFEKKFKCKIKFKPRSFKKFKKLISIDASHHMGGIICGDSKNKSVLNLNLSLHEENDIFVCGGALFPFSGVVNPTMSYVALAIWLTDKHL